MMNIMLIQMEYHVKTVNFLFFILTFLYVWTLKRVGKKILLILMQYRNLVESDGCI